MRNIILIGAASALLAVILGAFAAHGLKAVLSADQLKSFSTAVEYQMYHSLALLIVASMSGRLASPWCRRSAILFLLGMLLFSGSIYVLTLTGFTAVGPVTPVGGVCLMAGWLCFAIAAWKGTSDE